MATLLISAAVNIGVGLALNFLFPQRGPDINQEGPRLSDLSVTSSAYGRDVPFGYGTIRQGGNIIWSPGIEEVVNTETQSAGGKGGGGGSASLTTYTYFASFAIAFGEGVAQDVLRIWADGKLIFDKTGTGLATSKGLKFRFYKGDETQLPDSLIEAEEGAGNVPAHRGMCYLVAERWPLADFGNRVPQITAEIAYDAEDQMPFTALDELSGVDIPGSASGADSQSHMVLDPGTDYLYMFKDGSNGTTLSHVGTMTMTAVGTRGPLANFQDGSCLGTNKKVYVQSGSANYEPFYELDGETLQETGRTFGGSGTLDLGGDFIFRNGANFGVLEVGAPELGIEPVEIFLVVGPGANSSEGLSLLYKDATDTFVEDRRTSIGASRRARYAMHDYHNKRVFVTMESDAVVDLYEVVATLNIGTFGPYVSPPEVELRGTYAKGGVQYAGTGDTVGWCVLPDEEAIVLSNGSSMFKVDMNDGSVLATNLTLGFQSKNQWSDTGLFAFGNGAAGSGAAGVVRTVDTDDLTVLATQDLASADFDDSGEANYPESAYDPRSHSLIYSRLHGTSPSNGERIVRVLLQRANGLGDALSDVVADLCGRAGLSAGDYDVSALTSTTVQGYSVNRQGSVRAGLEPLQRAFLFEGVESDWKLKFTLRGGSPVLTVAEDDLGRLTSDTEEFVREVRQQEVELPSTFEVLYSDRDKDYQQGRGSDRRVSSPVPSQYAQNDITLELPVVLQAQEGKQLAQRWLYTSWAERLSMSSALPWKYIRLDPADVFNLTFRGETRRLRMAELEVGANLDLDFRATQEDARSNDSDLAADGGLGLLQQNIPSGLPTRLHLLDIPLLRAQDASYQVFSRAYWAASGYDVSWPGSQLFQSIDDGASFQELGPAQLETAWGFVDGTLPDPGTTFTWDESATVDIKVVRGIDRFQSAPDLEVLNGANALAVLKADGQSEIVQFATTTQIDNGTVRLSRLLRGRRGTETISTGHGARERVVLLESGQTRAFQLPLSLLGVSTQFRGVTLNTLLEDAPTVNFAYTGQDLLPYDVVQVAGSLNGDGNLDISFKRRTRFNGELRDGTGTIPVNEAEEAYEIDIRAVEGGEVLNTLEAAGEDVEYDFADDFGLPVEFLASLDVDAKDRSLNFAAGTLGANAAIQTSVFKFGVGAVEFTPANNSDTTNEVTWPSLAAYNIGTGAFTVECWIRFKDFTQTANPSLFGKYDTSGDNRGWLLSVGGGGALRFLAHDDGTSGAQVDLSGPWSPTTGVWYHIAVSRDADGVIRLFLGGSIVATTTYTGQIFNGTSLLRMGRLNNHLGTDNVLSGFIDDARFVVGKAVYTGAFTPPAGPFISDDDTVLLAPMDANADNYGNVILANATVGSNVAIQTTTAKFVGAAEWSPASGTDANAVVSYAHNAAYEIGSQPFTLEYFVRFKSQASPHNRTVMMAKFRDSSGNRNWFFQNFQGALRLVMWTDNTSGTAALDLSGSWSPSNDTWYHVAATRDASNVVRLFVDGAQVASTTFSGTVDDSAIPLMLGHMQASGGGPSSPNILNGFMDDVRVRIGLAAYTGAFTPPAAPQSLIAGPPSSVVVEVFQISDIVGRGRSSGQTLITL